MVSDKVKEQFEKRFYEEEFEYWYSQVKNVKVL